ncbi:hypothetical protein HQ571_06520 [Candidatus Kuenenbacteria bacterium]|nr:hypothetical protein [Candidatus Kuenenbacteria bacterium]
MRQAEQLQKQEAPTKTEKLEIAIETAEALSKLADQTIKEIEEASIEAIEAANSRVERGATSLGGAEDIEVGKLAITEVQREIQELTSQTQAKISPENPLSATPERATEQPSVGLRDTYTPDQLAELRAMTKDDYGEGLVSGAHKDAKTLEDHETAQREAYKALDEKIEAGIVQPDSITSDILDRLELRDKPEIAIENIEQITEQIALELKGLTEKGFIKENEAKLIESEAEIFTSAYAEAFPDATPEQIFEVTRDNSRKLAYQTERDKQVFSGSDHGTRHILEGNMAMADKIIASLGDTATAKDKVLIHQIIVDHDLGYTVGVAQAKQSFDASKDHPLFSTKFIEANEEYYTQKFGKDGYEMIRDGILQHSYPKSEYRTPTDPEKGFNPDLIRSITSTVDALGVTAETKCPAFFREPEVIKILQKVKLFADKHGGKVTSEAIEMYKDQLRTLADNEPDAVRKAGFHSAIENQFNPVTVEMTLGQYTGVLKNIKIAENEGKMVPHVTMDISRSQALLGDLFGDKISTKAFKKAMEDFGISDDVMEHMAKIIREIRGAKTAEEKKVLVDQLRYSSDNAVFEFAPELDETTSEIEELFQSFEQVTISNEVRDLIRGVESLETRTPDRVETLLTEFSTSIGEQVDEEDLLGIMKIQERIRSNIDNPTEFENAIQELKSYVTKGEKEFMGL